MEGSRESGEDSFNGLGERAEADKRFKLTYFPISLRRRAGRRNEIHLYIKH